MIAVDSSALLAVLFKEKGYEPYFSLLEEAHGYGMSVVNYVEASMVFDARKHRLDLLDNFIREAGIELISADARQATFAREAFIQYGKGNHAAGLNICDCFAYALAKFHGAPLLFKGGDFSKTDIVSALA